MGRFTLTTALFSVTVKNILTNRHVSLNGGWVNERSTKSRICTSLCGFWRTQHFPQAEDYQLTTTTRRTLLEALD